MTLFYILFKTAWIGICWYFWEKSHDKLYIYFLIIGVVALSLSIWDYAVGGIFSFSERVRFTSDIIFLIIDTAVIGSMAVFLIKIVRRK